jgi:transcriptional regulator with GAF, ATPase, and Fis domain
MPELPSGYLAPKRDDTFGELLPLVPGQRITLGRSPDSRVVLKDDLCSRQHSEISESQHGWVVRDLSSLNGTFVNEERAVTEVLLRPLDEIRMGRSIYVFIKKPEQLPKRPTKTTSFNPHTEGIEITQRLGQTKYLPTSGTDLAEAIDVTQVPNPAVTAARAAMAENLAVLYRLAFELAEADTHSQLAAIALKALLTTTVGDVGAVLTLNAAREFEIVAHQTRANVRVGYHKISHFVSREVMESRQAVLAEDVAANSRFRDRDSVQDLQASSLICAPVVHDGQTLGLVHLYRTVGNARLDPDDLEFTLAVAHQLGVAWHRLQRQEGLSRENQVLREQLRITTELIGQSSALLKIEDQITRVAGTKATVLIRGESGVGKELVARAIHFNSPRKDQPFICLNCAALTETLLESELFGHERGAFTGATERLIGKFEAADHGTIFLDEIGEMAPNTQAKLLRVLEGQPFERVGGNTPIKVDVRVVAATNRPLEESVREGRFRKDLYFRLQVVQMDVPALRERLDDIPLLAEHFLKRFALETGRRVKGFSDEAITKMQKYHWPGNIRELRNVVERAVALGSTTTIESSDIWLSPLEINAPVEDGSAYRAISLADLEKEHIARTLEHTAWNKSKAAKILGIERSTLDRKVRDYDLKKD